MVVYGDSKLIAFTIDGGLVVAEADSNSIADPGINAANIADTELSAIAGLTAASDKYIYFTSGTGAATATITAYMRGLLDNVDEATFKQSTNLEAETDYNAYVAFHDSVTIDSEVADNEILVYDTGNEWINQTLAESGIQPLDATLTDIADGTINEKIGERM